MPDKSKFIESAAGCAPDVPAGRSVDQAVVDFYIARRMLLIYPASHDQVKKSLSKAFRSLSAVLAKGKRRLTLTVSKEGLAVGERALVSNPTVFADLAVVLRNYQIAALNFFKGMEQSELILFLRLITTERQKILAKGGVAALARKGLLSHILIQPIDYSRLQVTEESEIQRSSPSENGEAIWQEFVSHLMPGNSNKNRGVPDGDGHNLKPAELADMLNKRILDPREVVGHYKAVVTDAVDLDAGLLHMSEGLLHFQQLIKELNPQLQKQFLAATFDQCAQTDAISNTAHLIDGLGGELIVRMLRQASMDGKKISPSLIAFVNKMGHLHSSTAKAPTAGETTGTSGLSSQNVESLLAHEQYDTYVDSGYGKLLKNLTRSGRKGGGGSGTWALVEEIEADLSGIRINAHIARAMGRLMTVSADMTDYRDWARQLAYLLGDLLDSRAFECLMEVMNFARREKSCNDSERSEIADLLLNRFNDPQFVARAIKTARKVTGDVTPHAIGFLVALGEPVVLEIFDGLDPDQTFDDDGMVAQILGKLSNLTVREALERIRDPRPDYVRCMLRIIRKMGDSESAQNVRALLGHIDFNVRVEALDTLLKFRNKWGVIRLRELLKKPMAHDFNAALRLAGKYRVKAVVPQLILILERRGDLAHRDAALRALGHIGDSSAIPTLTKLAHRRWSISRKQTNHLKRALYETLGGYSVRDTKPLLYYGLKQKDGAIQSTCRKFLREGTKKANGGLDVDGRRADWRHLRKTE